MKKVNITIGRFQPFHKGHKLMLEEMYKENGLPTVIFYITNTKYDKRHPFSDDITEKTIKESLKLDSKLFADCFPVRTANIVHIGEVLYNNNYEAVLFGCGSDRADTYKKQVDNPKYREQGHFTDDFKLFTMKRNESSNELDGLSATKVRETIKNDDYDTFCKMMSVKDKSLYNKMREEILSIKEDITPLSDYAVWY